MGKRSGAARGWAEGWPRPPLPRHEVPPSLGQATSGLPWPRRRLQAASGAASWGAARPAAGTILCFTCVCIRIRAFKCVAVTPAWPRRCSCKSSPPGTTRRIDTKKCQKKSKLPASTVGQGRSDNPGSKGMVAGEVRRTGVPPPSPRSRPLKF